MTDTSTDINRVITFSLSDSVIRKMNALDTEKNRSALIRTLIEEAYARKQEEKKKRG